MTRSLCLPLLVALLGMFVLAEVPKPNEHGIIELNPSVWKEVVMDENYDVLVEFYDPMCGYCQMLEPIYNQLGETFKNEDSVRITRINAARPENAIEGWPVPGTPYIVLFPAKVKTGIVYREHRSLNSFIEFIITHSDHPIDIPISYASQPIPEKNDGPVIEVVGKTFKEIVMNPNVDVFVNFYAPWCPYSQRLNPTWAELGKRLESQRDKIVIAQMDGTQNEVPGLHIHAFPTVTLYQAGSKDEYQFKGARTVDALLEFAMVHAERSFQDPVTGKWNHEVPKDYKDHAVEVPEVTDANFEQVIGDRNTNVVVLYYAAWDPHSQELFHIWTYIAGEYKSVDNIRIVQMDASKSHKAKVSVYPTIALYPANRQNDESFLYKGKDKGDAKLIMAWINEKAEKSRAEKLVLDHEYEKKEAEKRGERPTETPQHVLEAKAELQMKAIVDVEAETKQSLNYIDTEEERRMKNDL